MGVFSMLDEFTLEEVERIINQRIKKLNISIKRYDKESTQWLVYKNLIMELQVLKDYIKSKR
jgi:hypothetical protein